MKMPEFISKYCQDIVNKNKQEKSLIDSMDLDFSYDAVIDSEDGSTIKIIYTDEGKEIPIGDILGLKDTEFRRLYPDKKDYEAYKNYLSAFVIIEGEEVLNQIRNEIQKSKERIEKLSNLDIDSMLSPFDIE